MCNLGVLGIQRFWQLQTCKKMWSCAYRQKLTFSLSCLFLLPALLLWMKDCFSILSIIFHYTSSWICNMTCCHQPSHFSHRPTLGRLVVSTSVSLLKENISSEASHRTPYTCNFACTLFYRLGRARDEQKPPALPVCRVFRQLHLCWKDRSMLCPIWPDADAVLAGIGQRPNTAFIGWGL